MYDSHALSCSGIFIFVRRASLRRRDLWINQEPVEDNEVEPTSRDAEMSTSPLNRVLQHILTDSRPEGGDRSDSELLARFVRSRDGDAISLLVRRHASMVWGVCRRLLHNHHDAEDAFQATFLVLVRKARHVPREAVPNWLYGVARQTAVRLRSTAAKRGLREAQVVVMPEPTNETDEREAEFLSAVDEEFSRLPERYRTVVLLCDLEGMTRKVAARQLGIPEGSVASRLARARAMLADRLTRRGVVISVGSVASTLSAESASALAPSALLASTIEAANLLAAGRIVVSAKVVALIEGAMKTMFVSKLKSTVATALILAFLGTATTLLTIRTAAGVEGSSPEKDKRVEQPAESGAKVTAPFQSRIKRN